MLYCEVCKTYVNVKAPFMKNPVSRSAFIRKALRPVMRLYGNDVTLEVLSRARPEEIRERLQKDLEMADTTAAIYMNEIATMLDWARNEGYVVAPNWNRSSYSGLGTKSPFFNKCNLKNKEETMQSSIVFQEPVQSSIVLQEPASAISSLQGVGYDVAIEPAEEELEVKSKRNPFADMLHGLDIANSSFKNEIQYGLKCDCANINNVSGWFGGNRLPNIPNLAFIVRTANRSIGGIDVAGKLVSAYIDYYNDNNIALTFKSPILRGLRSIIDFYELRGTSGFRYLKTPCVDIDAGYSSLSRWYGYVSRWLNHLHGCGVSDDDIAKALGVPASEVPRIIDTGFIYHSYRDLARAYHVSGDITSTEWNDFVVKSIATLYANMIYSEFVVNDGNTSRRVSFEASTSINSNVKAGDFDYSFGSKMIEDIERKLSAFGDAERYKEYVSLLRAIYRRKTDATHFTDEEVTGFLESLQKYGVTSSVSADTTDIIFIKKEITDKEETMSNLEPITSTEAFHESIKLLADNWQKMQSLRDLSLGSDPVTSEILSGTRKQIHSRICEIAGSIANSKLDSIDNDF